MTIYTPLLTQRSVLLAGMETTYGTIPSLAGSTDAQLVAGLDFAPKFKMLQRAYQRASLSPFPIQQGMKYAELKFTAELANTGVVGTEARLGRLLRGCGFLETVLASNTISNVYAILNYGITPTTVSWATAGASLTNTDPITYTLRVTTPGASGTAKVSITPNDPSLDTNQTAVTVTSGTALTVGAKGLTLTPTFTGSLVAGQGWSVTIYPPGILYTPRSTGFESVGMQFYYDGSVHSLAGCFGTVSMKCDAGDFATLSFDFMGSYVPNADSALPTPTFDSLNEPPLMTNACVSLADFQPVISSFTWDIKNKIAVRSSANSANGYLGTRITDRTPVGGIDPEATLVANHDFWNDLTNAVSFPLTARFGSTSGNKVAFLAPAAQYTGLTYKDNNGIRNYNGALQFGSLGGDDELSMLFY